ncbi:MAG: hypothetical protein IKN12_09955 [Selenomonadaceae bacterium]|nr:hypothetical protein [Selenomonadaceae bacterium]
MFGTITDKFKENPLYYYGLSIAASWAGVGSLLNSITITQQYGWIPSLIWAAANVAACIVFGIIVHRLPEIRDIMRTKTARYIVGAMAVFHIWLNMNGIQTVFSDTIVSAAGGTAIAYIVAIGFIFLLLWRGMIRNILTDSASWIAVYGLIALITILAFIHTNGNYNAISLGMEKEALEFGIEKALLLLPGPFTFIYFFEIMDYNDSGEDKARRVNMQTAFTLGGLLFGGYMLFALALALVQFTPTLNFIKAVLISLIAISTLSTFIFSTYIVFGRKIGLAIDIVAVLLWPIFIEMGVMGVWTLVTSIRTYLVGALLVAAIALKIAHSRRCL